MPDNTPNRPLGRTPLSSRLLATKLYIPHPRPNQVVRSRLAGLLDAGCAARLILLSAPAGSGKTTLLAAALQQGDRRVAWLALDASDNDLTRFLTYVVAAVAAALPTESGTAAEELQDLLRSSEPPGAGAVLAALVNTVALGGDDLTLVLDDFHVITSPSVHGAVAFLLDHSPSNLHLAIATRADPPLPLARLRSRGQLIELRADDLRFTPEETATFLDQTMGLALSPSQAAALGERTEGWIAGLQLAALTMRGRKDIDSFIRAFAGSNRFILDFLLEEVLSCEPPAVQTFLLHTAVLNPFCAELCDAVTGRTDSRQMLEQLERRNLFIVALDDERCWYRYHQLFADLLQARLHQLEPEQAAGLQSRAATWCEREGQMASAISYALAAKDYAHAADLVVACWGPATNEGEIETAWTWLSALPEDVVRNSVQLSIACCWVLWLKGQTDLIEAYLVDAEAALNAGTVPKAEDKDRAAYVQLLVQLTTLRSFVARYHAEFSAAVEYAERARRLANENWPAAGNAQLYAQLHALIALALASAYDGAGDLQRSADAYAESAIWSRRGRNATGMAVTYRLTGVLRLLGRLRMAEETCRETLQFLEEQGMARLPAAGVLHLALAELLLERNELEAAEDHLARGCELGRSGGRLDAVRNAARLQAHLRLIRGDTAGALTAVVEAMSALGESPSPLSKAELLSLQAEVLVRQGALDAAAVCVAQAEHWAGQDRGLTREIVVLATARLQLAQCKENEALPQLAQALADSEERGWFGAALELRILRSLALAALGDTRAAEADLEVALALAEPQGYRRLFLDEGERMAELLRTHAMRLAQSGASSGRTAAFLAALIAAFDAPGSRPAANYVLPSGPPTTVPIPGSTRYTASSERLPALVEPLSERELEVLRLMAEGLTNEQIARRLMIALGTVKAHIHNIAGKLAAQNRAHAVARAQELRLL